MRLNVSRDSGEIGSTEPSWIVTDALYGKRFGIIWSAEVGNVVYNQRR